jgi:hypothetical protein
MVIVFFAKQRLIFYVPKLYFLSFMIDKQGKLEKRKKPDFFQWTKHETCFEARLRTTKGVQSKLHEKAIFKDIMT